MTQTESFEDLLAQFDRTHPESSTKTPAVGDRVQGTLVSIGEDDAFVDLGGKSEGRIALSVLKDAEGHLKYGIGDRVDSYVTGKDEDSGLLLLGSQHGQRYQGLEELERAYRQGLSVQGQVTGAVKGGVEIQVAGLRGFCPASQVDLRFIEDLNELVGQRLDFRITKLEGGRRPNLVLSRKVLLEEEQRQRAAETRARLIEGAVLSGVVTSLKDYGAFVDLGGLEGMIHISQLAFGHVKHPGEVLSVGQAVEVSVIRIEPPTGPKGREKIALSIRALARDPWQDAVDRFPVGRTVVGTVSRLQPFGAFIELEPGIDGLVHISELGVGRRVNHPGDVLTVGDRVDARVLGVDPERRRISLSLSETKGLEPSVASSDRASEEPKAPTAERTVGSFGELLRETLRKG